MSLCCELMAGNKCKFSHDLNVGRKDVKASIYEDARQNEEEKKKGTVAVETHTDCRNHGRLGRGQAPRGCEQKRPEAAHNNRYCVQVLHPGNRGPQVWMVVSNSVNPRAG